MSDTAHRDEVLAWMASTGRGYRAAEKQFGIPRATVQAWKRGEDSGQPVKPNSRTSARAREPAPPPPTPVAYDPSSGTYEEFLIQRLVASCLARDQALAQEHAGVARQWETTIGGYREDLERVRDERRRADDAKGRSQQVDPSELARRLCRRAVDLARLVPDDARRLYHALGVALGEREAG